MDATPIDFGDARPLAGGSCRMEINSPPEAPAVARARTWDAIHEAALTVGLIAGVDTAQVHGAIARGRGGRLVACEGSAAGHAIEDLADTMQRGIAALLRAHTSGGAPQAAALALWREFLDARDAILPAQTRVAILRPHV